MYTQNQIVEAKSGFVYDALYRLKEATGREHHSLPVNAAKYGEEWFNARKTHINDLQKSLNYRRTYEYDLGNNLTKMQHFSADGTRNFTRDITVSQTSNRAMPSDTPPKSPEGGLNPEDFFDKNGNMKSLDHLVKLEWNYSNNISKAVVIERNDGTIDDAEYYIYDSSGNRVRKITQTWKSNQIERRETIYLGGVEIKKTFHQTPGVQAQLKKERVDHHVMDDTKRIAIVNTWTYNDLTSGELAGTVKIRYQYSNHLGSASLELNDAGEFVSYQEYFPFGETAYTYGTVSTEYRFTGKERDEFTGLYYFGARYYAPWMFRWMNPDPSGPVDGLNVFVYVSNRPIVMVDPDGRKSIAALQQDLTPVGDQTGNTIPKETLQSFEATRKDLEYVDAQVKHTLRYFFDADYRKALYQKAVGKIKLAQYKEYKAIKDRIAGDVGAAKWKYQAPQMDNVTSASLTGSSSIAFTIAYEKTGNFDKGVAWANIVGGVEQGVAMVVAGTAKGRIKTMDANLAKSPSFNMETPLQEMLRTSSPNYINTNNLRLGTTGDILRGGTIINWGNTSMDIGTASFGTGTSLGNDFFKRIVKHQDLGLKSEGVVRGSHKVKGHLRGAEFGAGYPKASLEEAIKKFAPNAEPWETPSGKMIYLNRDTGIQIVHDIYGNYFRIQDTNARGVAQYLDLNGNVPLNKVVNGKTIGINKDERHLYNHFTVQE